MRDEIQSLSDQQAALAVRYFFDLSPAEVWEGGHKPAVERVKTVVAALRREAPGEIQPVLEGIVGDSPRTDAAARGAICRALLEQLAESPALRPSLEQAVARARAVHMALDPLTGVFILALLLVTTRTEKKPDGTVTRVPGGGIAEIISSLRLPEMLDKLPAVIKALPTDAVNKLLARFGITA